MFDPYRLEQRADDVSNGSHMPLDTTCNWNRRNPLTIIPLVLVLIVAIALLALILGL